MKKIISLILTLISLQSFSQQAKEVSGNYDNIGKFYNGIAIVRLNGKVGAINGNGKEVIKPEWDKLTGFGKDGIAFAHRDGLVGLIDKNGKLIAKPIYQRISNFKYGRAIIMKDNLQGIIDMKGRVLVEPKYQKLVIDKGMVRATENGKEVLLKLAE